MKQIGSQNREPLSESGLAVRFGPNDDGEVILNDRNGNMELWQKTDDFAGYVIEINGKGYEFARGLTDPTAAEIEKKVKEADATLAKSYEMGYDAGKNGPNVKNCHYSLFATTEQSNEWSAGSRDGMSAKTKQESETEE